MPTSKAALLVIVGVLFVACTEEASDLTTPFETPVYSHSSNAAGSSNGGTFVSPLSGAEEVPARETRARGNAIFRLNAAGDELTYQLIVANIENVFMAHIHQAEAGANGGITVWLYPSTTPGEPDAPGGGRINGVIAEGTITEANLVGPLAGETLSALVDDLKSGNAYVNVHTNDGEAPPNTGPGDFPGGEIRGQIEHRGH